MSVKQVDSMGLTPSGLVATSEASFNLDYPCLADLFLFGCNQESDQNIHNQAYLLNQLIVDYFRGNLPSDILGDAVAEIAKIDPTYWFNIQSTSSL